MSFRVTPYDQFGRPLDASILNYKLDFDSAIPDRTGLRKPPIVGTEETLKPDWLATHFENFDRSLMLISETKGPRAYQFFGSVFLGELVPTTVEFELAVLEPRALEQLRSLPIGPATTGPEGSARDRYLKRNLGKIQIFRQRVPIRVANRQ